MSQPPLPLAPFRNEGLFADHYLQDVLPETDLWVTEGMEQVRQELLALWQEQQAEVAQYNESQLEEHFIKPALEALGHVWEVQPRAGDHRPDYGFFPDDETRVSVLPADGRREYWAKALAVGDAKSWERRLDKADSGGSGWSFQNPSFQVGQYYLAETGCRWAILTNGRHWRLYTSEPKPDMQRFYEVDLPELLESDDPEHFAYFCLFFRRAAFAPDLEGQTFLGRVRGESDLAAGKLREDVKEAVYRALLEACRGFVKHGPNQLAEGNLTEVYDNALVFLYRLLFALYAEAAELLPLRTNAQYRDHYSLHAIKQEVAQSPDTFVEGVTGLWSRLRDLFRTIDQGHDGLDVPAYNGGLFDTQKHAFLEQNQLADVHVARVVDLLARRDDERTGERRSVDYRDLGVRHLGSIYEGLLEYKLARAVEPMVVVRQRGKDLWAPESEGPTGQATRRYADAERCKAGEFYLVTDRGERKATGSYYTPQFIVEYIVENTIGRVVDQCETTGDILDLKVLDPAMGSGHFLVEATNFLARKLMERGAATARWDEGLLDVMRLDVTEPDEEDLTSLKRVVVEQCIYGVDLNPLAVELAKLSLWLDTVARGQPLSFLDHHLRCGNSLIGARIDDLPTPPQPKAKKRRAKAARQEEAGQLVLFDYDAFVGHADPLVSGLEEISRSVSDSREAVQHKGEILAQIEQAHRLRYRQIGDLWCSRHFGNAYDAATYNELVQHLQTAGDSLSDTAEEALANSRALAAQYRFFHWELEFPEVFLDEHGRRRDDPGFDAVVGNPPWERIKLQENEFFARRAPRIALAPTAAKRRAMIADLEETDPALREEYEAAKEQADLELAWARNSGQYPLMGRGDTNLYAVMTERARCLLTERGRAGFVVPSGIATDKTTSAFFADLVQSRSLQTLLDFENRRKIFADLDSRFKFTILIMTGGEEQDDIRCAFFLHTPHDMQDPDRVLSLHPEDCELMNPNTHTCPVFRTRRDAELTRSVYERVPVLVRETEEGEENPWGIRYATMLHMTNDSGLFRTAEELEEDGFWLGVGNIWHKGDEAYAPLYVGKTVRPYDHRAASIEYHATNPVNPYVPSDTTDAQKRDPTFSPMPHFWVDGAEVSARGDDRARQLVYRNISRPTDERSMIAAMCPPAGFGNALGLVTTTDTAVLECCLLANLSSFVLDYCARVKMGGTNMNFYIVRQLPILPPDAYSDDQVAFIRERVLELTYTAHDIGGFAVDMGHVDDEGKPLPPFVWDEERRLHLKCQLDALYFQLYGLTRDEADYVLETFPIVKRHDEEQFGKYRTKELILQYYNAYAAGDMEAWVQG